MVVIGLVLFIELLECAGLLDIVNLVFELSLLGQKFKLRSISCQIQTSFDDFDYCSNFNLID